MLAYSTVSQLGYMMLALGLGGWLAGLFHLITHAFFKSLLFLCSGSVIHAVHTNDMTQDGRPAEEDADHGVHDAHRLPGDHRRRHSVLVIGFSGYYSKDAIVEQALQLRARPTAAATGLFFVLPVVGAAITAFYMFRLWFMTFAGKPRDHHRYDHAHESPPVMTRPLVLLAVFAIGVGWTLPFGELRRRRICWSKLGRSGTRRQAHGVLLPTLTVPDEHLSHAGDITMPAGIAAFGGRDRRRSAGDGGLPVADARSGGDHASTFQPLYNAAVEQMVVRRAVRRRVRAADAVAVAAIARRSTAR